MLSFLRWDEREPYEKAVMAGLAALIVLAVLYLFAIKPVLDSHKAAETQSAKALRDYEIVSRAVLQLGQGTVVTGAPFDRSVLINAARRSDINLSRLQPDGDSLTIWVDDIETVKLYGLLNTLVTQNGAELTRAVINANDNGLLSAQISIKTSS